MKKLLFAVVCLFAFCGCSKDELSPETADKLTGTFSSGKTSYSFHPYDKTVNVSCRTDIGQQKNIDVDGFCVYRNNTKVRYFYFDVIEASSKFCRMKKYYIDSPTNISPSDGEYIGTISSSGGYLSIKNIKDSSITIDGEEYRRK